MDRAFLIVNADDLGLAPAIDRAIFDAHDRGIVTSASLLAVGPSFEDAVAGLRARPRLGAGVHLALHDERPVLDPGAIPALVGPDGRFPPLGRVLRRMLAGDLPRAQVEAELAAQIRRALDAGVRVDHLDSHCHLHAFPAIGPVVHALGRRFAIPCVRRAAAGFVRELAGAPPRRVPLALLITACERVTRFRVADPLRAPARLLGLARSGAIDARWLARAIARLPRGEVTELMVHPGDGSGGPYGGPQGGAGGERVSGARSADHGALARRRELDAVTSPAVLEAVRRAGVELVGYGHLAS